MIVPRARREKPRPEGTGRILTDGRQLSQGGSGRRGHMAKLPANLLADSLRPVRGGQSGRVGGIRGGTQGVRAHMRDARGLPGRWAAATAAGAPTSRAAAPPTKRRRISPRCPARHEQTRVSGRWHHGGGYRPGASASNNPSTRSAQSAAHTATIRRSASLSVCGEPTPRFSPVRRLGLPHHSRDVF